MAPAAAPPHRGLPAGQAGPRRWPDRQGAGRLASPGAAASHLGRSYGRGGSEAAPAGGRAETPGAASSARVASPRAASPEEARRPVSPGDPRLRPRRRPPLQAALPAPRAAPPPLSGFAVRRGSGWPRPHPDSRYGCGGRRPTAVAPLLIALSPPSQVATLLGPARPSHLQRALETDRACASAERATLARTQGRHHRRLSSSRAQRPRAAAELRVPAAAARPAPWARRSIARVARAAQRRACAARSGPRRRPGAGARRRGGRAAGVCLSAGLLGACSRETPQLTAFHTDSPAPRPSQDHPNAVPLLERVEPPDFGRGKHAAWECGEKGVRAGHSIEPICVMPAYSVYRR